MASSLFISVTNSLCLYVFFL